MANCPRFMIAENPMAEPDAEYVLHTQQPRFIAKRVYNYTSTDFVIVDEIDNISAFYKNDPLKAAGLMRRLDDWYLSFIKWEENNYGDK